MKIENLSLDEIVSRRKDLASDKASLIAIEKAPASWNAETRTARFVMSSQNVDRMGDIVVTDGLNIDEFMKNPVGLLFHDSRTWPIGKWENLEKHLSGRPKRLEGDLVLLPGGGPVKAIDEAEWMLANGGIRACSIGFVPNWDTAELIKTESGEWTGGIKWNQSELVECSVCAVPANPDALMRAADGNMRLAKALIEDVLDNWAKSPEGALLSRSDFEATYKVVAAPAFNPEVLKLRLRRLGV